MMIEINKAKQINNNNPKQGKKKKKKKERINEQTNLQDTKQIKTKKNERTNTMRNNKRKCQKTNKVQKTKQNKNTNLHGKSTGAEGTELPPAFLTFCLHIYFQF